MRQHLIKTGKSEIGKMAGMITGMLFEHNYLYLDSRFARQSTGQFSPEYKKFSQYAEELLPEYEFQQDFSLKPKDKNFTINFKKLKSALLSKDEADLKEFEPFFDHKKGIVFLDETVDMEEEGEKICYITFPRVGNTFLRMLL